MELNYSKKELAEIWNKLNSWEWDYRLGEKPEKWDVIPNFRFSEGHKNITKYDIIKPYMKYIEKKIGEKECMRWHHLHNCGRNNLQFELWWLKNKLCKFFKIGFYSRKTQKQMKEILMRVAEKNQEDWISETYYPKKED